MTPGSRPWVVRAIRDWALTVRQGMALVTYKSSVARALVLDDLTPEFTSRNLKVETLWCAESGPTEFVAKITASNADVLYLLDPDRLLFGANGEASPFWVNFQRETLVNHPAVQIWWMLPNAATRFGQQLPDLNRFFLFREDLTDEAPAWRETDLELREEKEEPFDEGDPERARDLLERALQAAAQPNADAARVWLELGIPAIAAYSKARYLDEAVSALEKLTVLVGPPEPWINDPQHRDRRSAAALMTLALLYWDLGRWEDTLRLTQEAVATYRVLANQDPEATNPDLARSLHNLANALGTLGRREEALECAEEAVPLYRQLAKQRPDAFLPDLAASLSNLARRLSDLGRRDEALERAEEGVALYRQLAQRIPGAVRPDLALSLNNLAAMLSDLGRREEALDRAREAVGIYRQLALERPHAFRADMAMSFNNLANILAGLERREEALERAEEAVGLYRQLAQERPDAFLPYLAMSLNNLANMLRNLGRREEALERAYEAVGFNRQLAQQCPDVFQPDLAMSLHTLANMLCHLGRPEEALERACEAVGIRRELAQQRPDAFRPDLAGSLTNLADTLRALGRHEEAIECAEEAVGIYRQLAEQRPDAFLPDLARSLCMLGIASKTRSSAEAMTCFADAIRILTPYLVQLPETYAPLMRAAVGDYLAAAHSAHLEPEAAILERANPILLKTPLSP